MGVTLIIVTFSRHLMAILSINRILRTFLWKCSGKSCGKAPCRRAGRLARLFAHSGGREEGRRDSHHIGAVTLSCAIEVIPVPVPRAGLLDETAFAQLPL